MIDFGVAQQYDENGLNSQERGDTHSYDRFSAPENSGGGMKHFCPQSDIYSTASTLYTMLTGLWPKPVNRETYDDAWENLHCSDQMKHAIMEGMKEFLNDRPATAQAFLNLFPGCEDIKL